MIELNLLPDVKKEFIRAQRTRNTVISIAIITTIAAGVITAILATTVYIGQAVAIKVQTDDIKKKANELKSKPEIDKYLTIQNQLKNLDQLHNGKYAYSRAFNYLQKVNPAQPNNVALSKVTFTKEGNILVLEGTSRNFEALAVYKTTLENASLKYKTPGVEDETTVKLFDTVSLTEASLSNIDGKPLTSFKILVTYPEVAFSYSTSSVDVTVPNVVTSDGDRNTPKELFGSQPGGN